RYRREGIGVEPTGSRPDLAELLHVGLHLIGGLRVAWRIQRRGGRGHGKGSAAESAEDAVELPAACEQARQSLGRPPLSRAERQQHVDVGDAPIPGEEGAAIVAAVSALPGVDVDVGRLADRAGGYVSALRVKACADVALNCEVERLNVAAFEHVRERLGANGE